MLGSVARGAARARSDVDIGIPTHTEMDAEAQVALRIDIVAAWEKRLRCGVDVMDLRSAPAHLVHAVLVDRAILKGHQSSVWLRKKRSKQLGPEKMPQES